MIYNSKKYSKIFFSSYSNTQYDNNNRIWLFIDIKKFLNCTVKTTFLGSFRFLVDVTFKGIIKRAEPHKCCVCLVSRILWHKRITPFLKERLQHLILTNNFSTWFFLTSICSTIPVKVAYFHLKKLVT